MKDTNGIVSVLNATGTAYTDADNLKIVTAESAPAQQSVSSIVKNLLVISADAVCVAYNSLTRRFLSSPVSVIDDYNGVTGTKVFTFTPDAGQSGRSLAWTATAGSGFDTAAATALGALVATAKPTVTAEALMQSIVKSMPADKDCIVVLDQDSRQIRVYTNTNFTALSTQVDFVGYAASNFGIALELSEPVLASTGAAPLVFEGGAV